MHLKISVIEFFQQIDAIWYNKTDDIVACSVSVVDISSTESMIFFLNTDSWEKVQL